MAEAGGGPLDAIIAQLGINLIVNDAQARQMLALYQQMNGQVVAQVGIQAVAAPTVLGAEQLARNAGQAGTAAGQSFADGLDRSVQGAVQRAQQAVAGLQGLSARGRAGATQDALGREIVPPQTERFQQRLQPFVRDFQQANAAVQALNRSLGVLEQTPQRLNLINLGEQTRNLQALRAGLAQAREAGVAVGNETFQSLDRATRLLNAYGAAATRVRLPGLPGARGGQPGAADIRSEFLASLREVRGGVEGAIPGTEARQVLGRETLSQVARELSLSEQRAAQVEQQRFEHRVQQAIGERREARGAVAERQAAAGAAPFEANVRQAEASLTARRAEEDQARAAQRPQLERLRSINDQLYGSAQANLTQAQQEFRTARERRAAGQLAANTAQQDANVAQNKLAEERATLEVLRQRQQILSRQVTDERAVPIRQRTAEQRAGINAAVASERRGLSEIDRAETSVRRAEEVAARAEQTAAAARASVPGIGAERRGVTEANQTITALRAEQQAQAAIVGPLTQEVQARQAIREEVARTTEEARRLRDEERDRGSAAVRQARQVTDEDRRAATVRAEGARTADRERLDRADQTRLARQAAQPGNLLAAEQNVTGAVRRTAEARNTLNDALERQNRLLAARAGQREATAGVLAAAPGDVVAVQNLIRAQQEVARTGSDMARAQADVARAGTVANRTVSEQTAAERLLVQQRQQARVGAPGGPGSIVGDAPQGLERFGQALQRNVVLPLAQSAAPAFQRLQAGIANFNTQLGYSVNLFFRYALIGQAINTVQGAISAITESYTRATRAQFELTKAAGRDAPELEKFARAIAGPSGRSGLEVTESIGNLAKLRQEYGLNQQQLKALEQTTLDLAAVNNETVDTVTNAVYNAVRGSGRALADLGVDVSAKAVKQLANMTTEQRKHYEALGATEQAAIRVNEILRQGATYQKAAAEYASSQAGAWQTLAANAQNLAETLGKLFAPTARGGAGILGEAARNADQIIEQGQRAAAANQARQQDEYIARSRGELGPPGPNDQPGALTGFSINQIRHAMGPSPDWKTWLVGGGMEALDFAAQGRPSPLAAGGGDATLNLLFSPPPSDSVLHTFLGVDIPPASLIGRLLGGTGREPTDVRGPGGTQITLEERFPRDILGGPGEREATPEERQIATVQQHYEEIQRIAANLSKGMVPNRDDLELLRLTYNDVRYNAETGADQMERLTKSALQNADEIRRNIAITPNLDIGGGFPRQPILPQEPPVPELTESEQEQFRQLQGNLTPDTVETARRTAEQNKDHIREVAKAEQDAARDAIAAARKREAFVEESYRNQAKAARVALDAVRDQAIVNLDYEQRLAQVTRTNEDRVRQDRRTQEDVAIRTRQQAEQRGLEDTKQAEEAAHKARQRNLEAEVDAARAAGDAQLRIIDQRRDAEDAAFEASKRRLDEEQDGLRDRVRVEQDLIDKQLQRIDMEERSRDDAKRDREQQDAIQSSQERLTEALTDRANLNDPKRLGQANQSVREAQRAVARDREAVGDTRHEREVRAERDALKARRDLLQDEQQAGERRIHAEQQALEDRHKAALAGLDAEKQAAQDARDARVKGAEDAKQAEQVAYEAGQAAAEAEKRRTADVEQAKADALARTRLLEDRALGDSRAAEDAAFQERQKAIASEYEQKSEAIQLGLDAAVQASQDQTDAVILNLQAQIDASELATAAKIADVEKWRDAFIDAVKSMEAAYKIWVFMQQHPAAVLPGDVNLPPPSPNTDTTTLRPSTTTSNPETTAANAATTAAADALTNVASAVAANAAAKQTVLDAAANQWTTTSNPETATVSEWATEKRGRAPGSTPRRHGGPVESGQTYMVGEAGPELLVMGTQSGRVIPLHRQYGGSILGGGSVNPLGANRAAGVNDIYGGRAVYRPYDTYTSGYDAQGNTLVVPRNPNNLSAVSPEDINFAAGVGADILIPPGPPHDPVGLPPPERIEFYVNPDQSSETAAQHLGISDAAYRQRVAAGLASGELTNKPWHEWKIPTFWGDTGQWTGRYRTHRFADGEPIPEYEVESWGIGPRIIHHNTLPSAMQMANPAFAYAWAKREQNLGQVPQYSGYGDWLPKYPRISDPNLVKAPLGPPISTYSADPAAANYSATYAAASAPTAGGSNVAYDWYKAHHTNAYGGGLAAGGTAYAGRTYLVGEDGPEMLAMGGGGFMQMRAPQHHPLAVQPTYLPPPHAAPDLSAMDWQAGGGTRVHGPLIGEMHVRNDDDRQTIIAALQHMLDTLESGVGGLVSSGQPYMGGGGYNGMAQ